jgi:hypothetical protein
MFTLPPNAKPYTNCFLVNVTPEIAKQWLVNNNFNRPLKPRLVDNYVRQILNGNWRRTHQGIAFDAEGVLLDGQHRLLAVINSGQTVTMLVFLNENQAAHESIDGGKVRSVLDVVRLELLDNTIKEKHLSVLKGMWSGRYCKNQNHLTAMELGNMFRRYHIAVRFAVDMLDSPGINDTTLMAVVARAYCSVSQDRLLEFCRILRTGDPSHSSAKLIVEFRDWLIRLQDRQEPTRRDIYKRAESLLDAFLKNATTYDVGREHRELFPIFGKAE